MCENYLDESVLTMLSKRQTHVTATIYTKNITAQLELDIKKYNAQYPKITLKKFDALHDRFLILDGKELYHIGASLKDLGKKWFAFSKFDMESFDILSRLEGGGIDMLKNSFRSNYSFLGISYYMRGVICFYNHMFLLHNLGLNF